MSNLKKFQAAISKLKEADSEIEDKILTDCKTMSKVENWVCVHATRYMPPRNSDGTMFLPTTAMVTNYDIPRTTVHVTLNHVVKSHAAGAWEDCPYVVFTPYTDLVRENEAPKCVSLYDTYFVPDSDRGLLLPPSAYIVQPSNGEFYEIGEHMATYKRGNYTEQEIKFILSLMPEDIQQKYKQFAEYTLDKTYTNYYFNISITDDNERQKILSTKYKQQMDKYAEDLLSSYLRDYVVRLAMESKGFRYISTGYDYRVSEATCDAVKDSGILTNVDEKSHFGSVERAMEDKWSAMHYQYITILGKYEASELYNHCVEEPYNNWFQRGGLIPTDKPKIELDILGAIVNNEPINFYNKYCDTFASFAEDKKGAATIAEYSPELDKALRKNAQILEKEFQEAVQILKQKPQYPKFERLAKRVLERCSKMNPGDSIRIPYWGPDNLEDGIDFEIPLPTKSPTGPIVSPVAPINKTRD
ncbi:MAG: hypothetical protein J6Y49_02545 [Alphaproteobacteria bacterium]|nr:hypothetical protein [Alphaproteobacteria bacterium]